ncbi:MAG: M14 family zinc carboxypeptidase, partial [Bacteroidota bacterium]
MRTSFLSVFLLFNSLFVLAQFSAFNPYYKHQHQHPNCQHNHTASANDLQYSELKIWLSPAQNIHQLARLGIDVTHGHWKKHQYFISEFSELERAQIQEAGFDFEVQIEDMQIYYEQQNSLPTLEDRNTACGEETVDRYPTPILFRRGSMGGYFTYEEMLSQFEEMAIRYPEWVSPLQEVPNIRTHKGNPVYWLRVSDHPNEDETDEPEVLYTALHHAREPMSLTQMIFYIWYLLENQEHDPGLRFLLENTELYFMPCVNPDSYIQNAIDRPNGGGMIRKNQRLNENG